MKLTHTRLLVALACVLAVAFSARAQKAAPTIIRNESAGTSVLNGAGKVGVIIVGSAAKAAWGVTKFVAKDMVVPIATSLVKPVAVHTAPAAAKFVLKKSAKYLLPLALKLSIL